MEISHILPGNERNKFPNPIGQLDPGVRMTESRVVLMNNLAKHILFTMRDLKSKMTVKTMLTIITREITGIDNFLFGQPVQGSNGSVGQLFEKFLPVTLQLGMGTLVIPLKISCTLKYLPLRICIVHLEISRATLEYHEPP